MSATPPILALHGWLGRGADWAGVAESLGRPIVAADLPGHGGASSVAAGSMDAAADYVLRQMDAAGGGRAIVAGYSMGGRLALHLALRHPRRVAGLLLVSASAGLAKEHERAARREVDAERARSLVADPAAFLNAWYASSLFDPLPAAARAELAADRLRHGHPAAWARALVDLSVGAQPWHGDRLIEIKVPAIVLAGAADSKFAAIARSMRAGAFECRLVPDAGHALLVERPDSVADAIREIASRATGNDGA